VHQDLSAGATDAEYGSQRTLYRTETDVARQLKKPGQCRCRRWGEGWRRSISRTVDFSPVLLFALSRFSIVLTTPVDTLSVCYFYQQNFATLVCTYSLSK